MKKIITSSEQITEALTRSVDTVYPSRQALKKALSSGKQMKIYVGIDPTAAYVHLGHSTNYLILERFHRLGHKIIVLVGDFTAMIGDPSDKTAARVPLSHEQILRHMETFKEQIGKILDFEDTENSVEFAFNSTWLSPLRLEKFIELASNFTVQQMLERDMFEKRLKDGKPLYVHEFFYPFLQGYDSVALEVDMEIGGTDQTFNMLAGRTLVRRYLNREKFVLTTPLLAHPVTKEKLMSKSFGTGIGLNESPEDMFGKVMALPDESIIQVFTDCTRLSLQEVKEKNDRIQSGENPRNIKLELAYELVALYHNPEHAKEARQRWEHIFSEKKIPNSLKKIQMKQGTPLMDVLTKQGFCKSKSEGRRLIAQGAVEFEGNVLKDALFQFSKDGILRVGKKRITRVELVP